MSNEPPLAYRPQRVYELDLLRFIAAFSVLLFHYSYRGYVAGRSVMPYPWITPVTQYGFLGVSLFFLISGFVILMTASGGSKRHFVISRLVRLYPAFWVCCTCTYLVARAMGHRDVPSPRDFIVNLTMLSGFVGVRSVDGVYWSLFIEIKFYCLVYLVMLFGQLHRVKALLGLWLAAYVVTSIWPVKYLSALLIPEYAPYFIAGSFFFLTSRDGVSLYNTIMLLACLIVAGYQSMAGMAEAAPTGQPHVNMAVSALVLTAFFAVFFLVATGRTRRWASPRFAVLGALTYPLYLLHQNVGYALFNLGYGKLSVHVLMWGVTALMLLAAYGVTRIERAAAPAMKDVLWRVLSRQRPSPSRIILKKSGG